MDVALEIAEGKLLESLDSDAVVLSKKVLKNEIKNSKIMVEVFLKVKEDITSYQDILDITKSEDGG